MNFRAWIEATRPKTLPASIVPVLMGSSLAYSLGYFRWDLFAITIICSILIQITTNFFNEVYDFKKGADSNNRVGPKRQVASGVISPKSMMIASLALTLITFILGLYLVYSSGFIILIVGILSLVFAFLYTGGPYPLAYNGLGYLFVFVFFGLVAVNGTFYVQTGELNFLSIVLSIIPGLLSANILNVNNIRDIETDHLVGKITLSYKLGKEIAIIMYIISTLFSFLLIIPIYLITENLFAFLPLISLPLAIQLIIHIRKKSGRELNSVLAKTGGLLFIYGILSSLSFLI